MGRALITAVASPYRKEISDFPQMSITLFGYEDIPNIEKVKTIYL